MHLDNISPALVKTNNRTGYITTFADPIVRAFIRHAAFANGPALEVAAGYGLPSVAAAAAGCRDITVSDIDESHLEYVRSLKEYKNRIRTMVGELPDHSGLPQNHFDAILISRVLHFFSGAQVARTLENIRRWLRPGGTAFLVCDSIFQSQFVNFSEEYQNRLSKNLRWPGYFCNMSRVHGKRSSDLPDVFHFFDESTLSTALLQAKLQIKSIVLFERPEYPPEKKLDGREGIGAIATKRTP